MKPRLLDLFCGGGGAGMGYHRAGFDVVGVDIAPHPNYPFEFHQADALTFPLDGFDVVHASPPCQAYSTISPQDNDHPDLYAPIRQRLVEHSKSYVIENVMGAPYNSGVIMCGSMFGMKIRRHRNFETSFLMFQPPCDHASQGRPYTITGNGGGYESKHSKKPPTRDFPIYMDMPWASPLEAAQGIPPAYTEYIGLALRQCLKLGVTSFADRDITQDGMGANGRGWVVTECEPLAHPEVVHSSGRVVHDSHLSRGGLA